MKVTVCAVIVCLLALQTAATNSSSHSSSPGEPKCPTICPNGQILDLQQCKCESLSDSSTFDSSLSRSSSKFDATPDSSLSDSSSSEYYIYDSTLSDSSISDSSSRELKCFIIDCPEGQILDKQQCKCVCQDDKWCPNKQDQATNEPLKSRPYRSAQLSERMRRQTYTAPAAPYHSSASSLIYCRPTRCLSSYYYFNQRSCRCERTCHITYCPIGQSLDKLNCRCTCQARKYCPGGQVFSFKTCGCVCQAKQYCPIGQVFSYKTCGCICQARKYCPVGQVFSYKTCRCVCQAKQYCPVGQVFSYKTCGCVCQGSSYCDSNYYYFNQRTCQCVCNRRCAAGYKLTSLCECVPLTCHNAVGASECYNAKCDLYPNYYTSISCSYNHGKCSCPCCVSRGEPRYHARCQAASTYGRVNCDLAICQWGC